MDTGAHLSSKLLSQRPVIPQKKLAHRTTVLANSGFGEVTAPQEGCSRGSPSVNLELPLIHAHMWAHPHICGMSTARTNEKGKKYK